MRAIHAALTLVTRSAKATSKSENEDILFNSRSCEGSRSRMAKRAVTEGRHHFIRAFNRSRAVNGERDLSPLATIVIRQRLGGHPRNTNTTTLRFSFSSPSFFLSFFLLFFVLLIHFVFLSFSKPISSGPLLPTSVRRPQSFTLKIQEAVRYFIS